MAAPQGSQTIVFFDGVCHLCNGFVDFAISRDSSQKLQFASLQGKTAQGLLSDTDRNALDSVIIITGDKTLRKSSAILHVLNKLGRGWKVLAVITGLIPKFLRDFFYDYVARNRYAWFGQREFCRLPTAAEKNQLLD